LNLGRILENGGAEEFIVQFSVDIWNQAGNCMDFNSPFEEKVNVMSHLCIILPYLFYEHY
jgi:hypothetical protein